MPSATVIAGWSGRKRPIRLIGSLTHDRRQVAFLDHGTMTNHDGPLDHVFELAHVARPSMLLQQIERTAGDAPHVPAVFTGVLGQEVLSQLRNVASAVP